MGTNYYLRTQKGDLCESCGKGESYEEIHIGKQSMGWAFCFNPQNGELNNFNKWRDLLEKNPDQIFTEYGNKVSLFKFYESISNNKDKDTGDCAIDIEGYRISKYSDFC